MILFLDFDGCLHPLSVEGADLFCCLPQLWTLLRRHPDIEVVFSTAWRERLSLATLQNYVTIDGGEDLALRFIGATPTDIDHDSERESRLTECLSWLAANGRERELWIAIDDMPDLFKRSLPNIYYVHPGHGLRPHDIEAISALISRLRK